jgi:hypothetical protein
MSAIIYKLQELMESVDINKLLAMLSEFKCSRNKDTERFLKKVALKHEAKNISRTYLVVDTDSGKILGYFTLAFKCLNVKDIEMPADVSEPMNIKDDIAQSYLIGQLARSDDAERGSGKLMLEEALKTFSKGKDMFGCQTVRLDCRDELIDYYRSQKFRHIRKNIDHDLNQMVTFI